jgi:putative oxidoreductase
MNDGVNGRTGMTLPQSFGMLLIRLVVGAVLMYHGSQKLFGWFDGPGMDGFIKGVEALPNVPMPKIAAWVAAVSEFGGGALLILGLLTRLAALMIAGTMGVAVFVFHAPDFQPLFAGDAILNKADFALTLCFVGLGLLFTGPGKIAIDHLLFGRAKRDGEAARK